MKKQIFITLLFGLLLAGLTSNAQQPKHFPDLHPDSVMRQNPRFADLMFEPGEVLVCFKDEIVINVFKSNGVAQTGMENIDEIFNQFQITDARQLIKGAEKNESKRTVTTFNGETFEVPNLHNIFLLKFEGEFNAVRELVEKLSIEKQVVFAEPNYIYQLTEHNAEAAFVNVGDHDKDVNKRGDFPNFPKSEAIVPDDPLYAQQPYISAIKADSAWFHSQGSEEHIIAILDTGVDWQHPDLVNKIWINGAETQNYTDTDGNGFIDDIRGWDFVNNDNNPMDDNGHGTHVAGIAAAETNNGIGIAGVSPLARIMPIKVLAGSGYGNAATIVQGINYAVNNDATIINMSFGSYARSLALENALLNAYIHADLVAAAGNDNYSIYYFDGLLSWVMYPAAFPYVFGVQSDGGFSNFDPDGPVISSMLEGFNYELKAPGSMVMSTFLNGTYKAFSGTSMAAPVVSGALSLYRAAKPESNRESLWADLIHYSDNFININQSIVGNKNHPVFDLLEVHLSDTLQGYGNDGDGFYDAGETISVWSKIRNTFNFADSAYIKLIHSNFSNPEDVIILEDSAYIGSISTYATRTNQSNPFKIQLNPLVPNGRNITMQIIMRNAGDTMQYMQPFDFMVYNGTNLSGIITEDITLTPDKYWLINASTRLEEGVTMTIMPGTSIEINAGLDNRGFINCVGTADSMINIKGSFGGNVIFKYTNFDLKNGNLGGDVFEYCKISNGTNLTANYIYKSTINDFYQSGYNGIYCDSIVNSRITNFIFRSNTHISLFNSSYINNTLYGYSDYEPIEMAKNTVFSDLTNLYIYLFPNAPWNWQDQFLTYLGNHNNNNFINNSYLYIGHMTRFFLLKQGPSTLDLPSQYWGSNNADKINEKFFDFWNNASLPLLNYEPKLEAPHPEAQGHVWKVLVNGADAQDEFVEPLGIGTHRFDVYFNRAMDTTYSPQFTFGVRYPFTQHAIADSSKWSLDSTIFTAWKTFHLYIGDGINRLRVADARDTDGWDIPIEDKRFEFLIDAAGSASIDFTATPGIGKVDLEWHEPDDLPTLLGYNMYRFNHLTDTTFSDTTMVNTSLINDTLFTDFTVDPLKKYYYMYKIVRTDFSESDFSKVVNATVLTASPGDANGDLAVNILDITHIVAYILNGTPQPFIFDAADVNADGQINLLDVISVVNIIMNGKKSTVLSKPATVYLNIEQAEIKSDGTLAGLQFQLIGKNIEQLEIKNLPKGFEFIRMINGDTLTGILFNMQNNTLPEGRISLFDIALHPGTLEWGEVFGGNYLGKYIPVFTSEDALPVDHRYSFNVFPNPTSEHFVSDIQLPSKSEVQLKMFDMYGRSINLMDKAIIDSGRHQFRFDKQQLPTAKGLYILQIKIRPLDKNELPFRKEVKIMIL